MKINTSSEKNPEKQHVKKNNSLSKYEISP